MENNIFKRKIVKKKRIFVWTCGRTLEKIFYVKWSCYKNKRKFLLKNSIFMCFIASSSQIWHHFKKIEKNLRRGTNTLKKFKHIFRDSEKQDRTLWMLAMKIVTCARSMCDENRLKCASHIENTNVNGLCHLDFDIFCWKFHMSYGWFNNPVTNNESTFYYYAEI